MKHFKIILETDTNIDRKVYVKRANIIEAMDVSKKIRSTRVLSIEPITYEEYMKGVALKYTNTKD